MERVLPGHAITDIDESDSVMHVLYDIEEKDRTFIPGSRHLRRGADGSTIVVQPEGSVPAWRAMYDDRHRMVVAANYNTDVGDAWEFADVPYYPRTDDGARLPLWDQLHHLFDDALMPARPYLDGALLIAPSRFCNSATNSCTAVRSAACHFTTTKYGPWLKKTVSADGLQRVPSAAPTSAELSRYTRAWISASPAL